MTFIEHIERLIPLPGHFIIMEDSSTGSVGEASKPATSDLRLDKAKAQRVFAVYRTSQKNSDNLLVEAQILLENGHFARAIALGIFAYEELGKSQIAADYYTGVISEALYVKSFKVHQKTSYAGRHGAIGTGPKVKHGLHIDDDIAKSLESIRQQSLYVDEANNPATMFTEQDARFLLERVKMHSDYIKHAEELNERIGSKALFK